MLLNSWKHVHYRHLRSHHQNPIRSEPERGGSRRFARVLLCVWEQLSGMRRQRRGTEGVIKLKRLGEDELLRIQESRHWLYNSNPVQSASTQADCDERTCTEPFIQTKPNWVIDNLDVSLGDKMQQKLHIRSPAQQERCTLSVKGWKWLGCYWPCVQVRFVFSRVCSRLHSESL